MPPSPSERKKAVDTWRGIPQGRDYSSRQASRAIPSEGSGFKKDRDATGPMQMQQQQRPQHLLQQMGGTKKAQV